jgi:septin family protein
MSYITTQKIMKDPKKVKELEEKVKQQLKEGEAALEKARKEAAEKEEGDQKPAAAGNDKKEEEADEIEDVPVLNLN